MLEKFSVNPYTTTISIVGFLCKREEETTFFKIDAINNGHEDCNFWSNQALSMSRENDAHDTGCDSSLVYLNRALASSTAKGEIMVEHTSRSVTIATSLPKVFVASALHMQ